MIALDDRPAARDVSHDTAPRTDADVGASRQKGPRDLVARHFIRRGHGLEFDMEARWVRRRLRDRGGCVVEVGCGIGALLETTEYRRTIGLDCNAAGLAHTRRRNRSAPLVCASAERLPFPPGSLDAMIAQHLIEHLSACRDACSEWYRALRPGGVLLLLTPNRGYCDLSVFDDETHVTLFDRDSLRELLLDVGFDVPEMRSLGLPWFRQYGRFPSNWRWRRFVTRHAEGLSRIVPWRWKGQTLCCVARRPAS